MPANRIPDETWAKVDPLLQGGVSVVEIAAMPGMPCRGTLQARRSAMRATARATLTAPYPPRVQSYPEQVQCATADPTTRYATHPQPASDESATADDPGSPPQVWQPPPIGGQLHSVDTAVEAAAGSGLQRVVLFGDAHIPYHDPSAWRTFLNGARAFKPDILVCLGDLADCYAISGYTVDPSRPSKWEDEVIAVHDALDQLDGLGASRKVFCGGNHEDRLPRYLANRAPRLFTSFDVPSLYRLPERGWEYVPHGQAAHVGRLMVTHDLDRYGIYAVRHALRDAGCDVVIGHVHRCCVWYEGSMAGGGQVAASFGWLGGAEHATYRHRVRAERDWQHGFGLGYLLPSGAVHLCAVPILDGECIVEGALITA